jgi:1-acyl-sn-glycerol-3-phosphate acyltransferase
VIVANHASWRDIPLLAVCINRPLYFVSIGGVLHPTSFGPLLESYLERYTPVPRRLRPFLSSRLARFLSPRLRALGAIPLASGHGFVRRIDAALRGGGAVVIFAQGRIRRGIAGTAFRPGVGWIACRAAARGLITSVVPVALIGTDRARLRSRLEFRAAPSLSPPPGSGRLHYTRFTRTIESRVVQLMRQKV